MSPNRLPQFKIDPSEFFVLVVDDESAIRDSVGEILVSAGFEVHKCRDGEEALAYLQNNDLPHIILTDIRMGGMTGIELAQRAKVLAPEIEIIIMTSHASFETAVQAMKIGVFDYLSKPFPSLESVVQTIKRVCERIFYRSYSEYLTTTLEEQNKLLNNLFNFSKEVSKTLEPKPILEKGLDLISQNFLNAPALFFRYDKNESIFCLEARTPIHLLDGVDLRFSFPQGVKGEELSQTLNKDPQLEHIRESLLAWAKEKSKFSSDCICHFEVFESHQEILGTLMMCIPKEYLDEESKGLHQFISSLKLMYENGILFEQTKESSIRDGLTGLYNSRYFKERIVQEASLAMRYRTPLSLIFLDVDHFKNFNDKNGHPEGDRLLKRLAQIIRESFRKTEIIARYGGEEFVILLSRCLIGDALKLAEKLRTKIEETVFEGGHNQPSGKVTVSLGVSELPGLCDTTDELIKSADEALYRVKKSSRNRVEMAQARPGYVPIFKNDETRLKSN